MKKYVLTIFFRKFSSEFYSDFRKTADASIYRVETFGMTKSRTADIPDFQNFEYENNESRIIRFFYV